MHHTQSRTQGNVGSWYKIVNTQTPSQALKGTVARVCSHSTMFWRFLHKGSNETRETEKATWFRPPSEKPTIRTDLVQIQQFENSPF